MGSRHCRLWLVECSVSFVSVGTALDGKFHLFLGASFTHVSGT